jgi:hypothetical protein
VDATDTANDLLLDREAQIDRILTDLHTDLEVVDAHQVDLSHVFAYLGAGLEGFSSIGYNGGEAKFDNPAWGNVLATELGPAGAQALLGCGGTLDQVFTQAVGPDPRCEGDTATAAADVTPAEDLPPRLQRADASAFFELEGRR